MKNRAEPIDVNQLKNQTVPSEWIRGKAYYRNGRVHKFSAIATISGEWSIQAEISASEAYSGRLTLTYRRDQILDWQCSCPLDQGRPCRHLVAVFLQSLRDTNSQILLHLLADQDLPLAASLEAVSSLESVKTDIHILFRYQKQDDRILVVPRVIKRDVLGHKVMSTNPLDHGDRVISSLVTDRMSLLRDQSKEQVVIDFFRQWEQYRQDPIGCLSFEADRDLSLLVNEVLPALPASWHILYDREFEKIIPRRRFVTVDFTQLFPSNVGLLSFDLDFHCEQLLLDKSQLQDYLLGQQKWLLVNGEFIEATNKKQLVRLVDLLKRLQQADDDKEAYEAEPSYLAELVSTGVNPDENDKQATFTFDDSFDLFRAATTSAQNQIPDSIPGHLDQILRPYQRQGVHWLLLLGRFRMGGLLADDMGLGKTLQVLTALASKTRTKPSLIICPKTLLYNWLSEARRFVPSMKTVIAQGPSEHRMRLLHQADEYDLLITSYSLVQRDITQYGQLEFDCVILDEAQMIKNPETHLARHVKKLKANQRIALTGTPMENTLMDLWSIFDFIMPGYLGPKDAFRIQYDPANQHQLLPKIKPFLMRRTKMDVLPELPAKIEETVYAPLTQNQLVLYQQVLTQTRKSVEETVEQQGLGRSRIAILAGLTRLRQICNHPGLLHEAYRHINGLSGKFDLFDEMLPTLLTNGHKVLVFSQFTQMLSLLGHRLGERKIPYCYLDGQTQDRQQVIHRFNTDPRFSVFLISLKAGGFGLNLTTADTVILFDPWWNPMVENQAADRVHRIGQTKVITVYRLISQGTIEEKIEILQDRKKRAFDRIINASNSQAADLLSLEDLKAILDEE